MRNRVLVAIAVGMLLPAVCPAQRAAAWHDSAGRAESAMRALHDSLLQGDSTATEVARRGELVIAASPNMRADAIAALGRFAQVRGRRFDGELPSTDGFRIVIRTGDWNRGDSPASGVLEGVVVLAALPDTGSSVRTQGTGHSSGVANDLIDRYGEMMVASVPQLSEWVATPPPLSLDERDRRDQAMYTFVTASGAIQRRCIDGGLVACNVALGIRPIDGPEHGGRYSHFIRADLLDFALDQGGPGAWSRLRGAADSGVAAMLSAAAEMPTDSVVARWRSSLLAMRPSTPVVTTRAATIAMAWSALLLLATLGASRWA